MISAHRLVRGVLGVATLAAAAVGVVVTQDPRWYALSGLLGTIWWLWDKVMEWLVEPIGTALVRLLHGDLRLPPPNLRPTAHETIRLLEKRLETPGPPDADVSAALRLADLYRAVLQDPVRANAIIEMMRERYPGHPMLLRYEKNVTRDE